MIAHARSIGQKAQAADDLYVAVSSEVVREELFALLDYQAFRQTMLRAAALDAEPRPELLGKNLPHDEKGLYKLDVEQEAAAMKQGGYPA